jgi:hypothetical protein
LRIGRPVVFGSPWRAGDHFFTPTQLRERFMKPETPPAAAKAKRPKAVKPATASPAGGHEEAVRRMAYLLYVERGRVDGYEVEDWLRAEALVSQQATASGPAAAPKAPKAAAKRAPAATREPAAAAAKPRAVAAKRAPAKPRGE